MGWALSKEVARPPSLPLFDPDLVEVGPQSGTLGPCSDRRIGSPILASLSWVVITQHSPHS